MPYYYPRGPDYAYRERPLHCRTPDYQPYNHGRRPFGGGRGFDPGYYRDRRDDQRRAVLRKVQEELLRRQYHRQHPPRHHQHYRHHPPQHHQHHRHHKRRHMIANHWRSRDYLSGYALVRRLGVGGLSESIKVVRNRTTHDLHVIKRVGKKARMREELEILKRIPKNCHLNYMVEYAWAPNLSSLELVLEYCDLGDLDGMIKDHIHRNSLFPEDLVWHILHDCGKGLAFMHSGITDPQREAHSQAGWNTICHLDIKPKNIFLSSSGGAGKHPRIVLGDFGCAITLAEVNSGKESARKHRYGTEEWYPPHSMTSEVGERSLAYGKHTDIWQLGAVAASVCRLRHRPMREQVFHDYHSPCGSSFSSRLNEVVRHCVKRDHRRRPNAAELVRSVIRCQRRR